MMHIVSKKDAIHDLSLILVKKMFEDMGQKYALYTTHGHEALSAKSLQLNNKTNEELEAMYSDLMFNNSRLVIVVDPEEGMGGSGTPSFIRPVPVCPSSRNG